MAILARRASDVRINEIDLSSSITNNSNATAALVVVSNQGPEKPTLYTTAEDFLFDFGNPNAQVSFDHYAALDYFKEGNSLWARRVLGAGALYSAAVVKNNSSGVTSVAGLPGIADPDATPDWGSYVTSPEVPIYRFTPKRGAGSIGNNLAVTIQSDNLDPPTGLAGTAAGTGGTLTAATYTYSVCAISRHGNTLASATVGIVVASGTTNSISLSWNLVPGAIGYMLFGRTSGSLGMIATLGGGTSTFVDTGAITPSLTVLPITNPANLPPPSPVFQLRVYDLSQSSTLAVETFTCSVTEQVDETGAQMEITQRINPFSNYLVVASNVNALLTVPVLKSTTTPVSLAGGASGSAPMASEIISALQIFQNKELYVIDVFIGAGRTAPTVQTAIDTLARQRGDSVGFLDVPPTKQKMQAALDFRNLELNLNSSYSALFCSDLLEMDPINGKMLFIPPSGAMAALYARTSRIAQPWFSIAGLNRGLLGVQSVRETYNDSQAGELFRAQINYMRRFIGKGIPLWEQSTLYNRNSALQFLNVRFLCNIIKRSVYDFLLYGLQEPNDDILWNQLKLALEDYMTMVQRARGVRSFQVIIDGSNNPPALMNSGVLAIALILVPVLPVREIQLSLVISKEGYSVSESEISSFSA